MEIKVQGRRKRGIPKRRWLDKVKDDMKCTTVLHGGVCHRTSTPHKSRNKMKRKKKMPSASGGQLSRGQLSRGQLSKPL